MRGITTGWRRWVTLASALGLALAGAAGCGLVGEPESSRSACTGPTAPPSAAEAPSDAAPGGGGLRVAERGFTQFDDHRISLGAVVENTSKRVAYRTLVTLDFVDAQGRAFGLPDHGERRIEIPVIRPGERVPVGTWTYVAEIDPNAGRSRYPNITEVRVALPTTHWVTEREAPAKVSATFKSFQPSSDPRSGTLYYTKKSQGCRTFTERNMGIVFRDGRGTVVGGTLGNVVEHRFDKPMCGPGTDDLNVAVDLSMPATADPARTELAPYCDLAEPNKTPGSSTAPFN